MDKNEKELLKTVAFNLKQATRVTWTSGDLDRWTAWGRRMRDEINSSLNILNVLQTSTSKPTITPLPSSPAQANLNDAIWQKEEAMRQKEDAQRFLDEALVLLSEAEKVKQKTIELSYIECPNCGTFVKS